MDGLDLKPLRMFDAVARHLSFTRAASELRVAQPWLSVQVRRLEEQLGVRLFERGRKRAVVLTAAGEALLPLVHELTAAHDRLAAEARRIRKGARLVLGAPEFSADIAERPRLLAALRARHPDIEVEIVNAPSVALIDQLRGGSLDMTMALGPSPDAGDLESVALADTSLWLLVPADHPLAAGDTVDMAALRGQTIGNFRRRLNPPVYDYMARLFAAHGVTMRHLPEASARGALLYVANERLPVIVTQWMAPLVAGQDDVVLRPLVGAPLRLQLVLVRRLGDGRPAVTALWNCACAPDRGAG